jgi:hypothetical protein
MKVIFLFSCLVLATVHSAPIAKITTLRGKKYRQCEIVSVHPDGVSFTHSNGAAKVLFTDLSKDWRNRLGCNSEKASAYQKELADKRLAHATAKAKREQELNEAMAEAEKVARYRLLGLAAQADAARRQQADNPLPRRLIPVLPALGAIHDGRSIEQSYARPGYASPWRGGSHGNYPSYPGAGFQFGGGFGGVGFNAAYFQPAPFCPAPTIIVAPDVSRHTLIRR